MKTSIQKAALRGATSLSAVALLVGTAHAQTAPQAADDAGEENTIVVTGSILKGNTGPSPVTVVQAEDLDKRGISTVQDAIQTLSSNNGPALTNSFSANGAFAAGASAVSLRGLSTNSTLVLFDGMRAAYYPLADDGSRNFVDLNTIPDDIVDHIEVLRDGASSSYGADAIAGVVNIITKKEIKGIHARAETGISDRGDASQYRLSLSAGVGDLDRDGYNAYFSGFYYNSNKLMNSQRGYPYNTDDARGICNSAGDCGSNGIVGGENADGSYTAGTATASTYYVRPANASNSAVIAGSRYSALNLDNCNGTLYSPSASDLALAANASTPTTICQVDYANKYYTITPDIKRYGASARFTGRIGDTIEAYAEFNFQQSQVSYNGNPSVIYGSAPTGVDYPQFRTSGAGGTGTVFAAGSGVLALPIYVCARNGQAATLVNGVATTPGCTAANGTLNPNNPYAAAGQVARIVGRDLNHVTYNETRSRVYRAAFGVKGEITDKLSFDVGGTVMHSDLRRTADGYVYIQHLLDVIADGSYNFVNPSLNSKAVNDYLYPTNISNASSDEDQIQATLTYDAAQLPGGPLQIGVGGSIRYEAVNAPSANSDSNGPTQRYFTLNGFGTKGSREVYSAYFEINAPVLDFVTINGSGRYDKYSSGQNSFSPKIGITIDPIEQVHLRGTYSKGFRIPSFGEANALPTTGYVNNTSGLFNDTYLSQYGCTVATFAACPTYIRSASYGSTTLASPNLKPEKSRSFTGGIDFTPIRNVKISVDYYNIKKTGAITSPDTGSALRAYYAGQAVDPSITIIANSPDINYPTATPTVAFVEAQLVNADTIRSSGLDFAGEITHDFSDKLSIRTSVEASYIIELSTTVDGVKQRYDGTIGNYNLTAGSGTPKWRGTWQTTVSYDAYALTGTLNMSDGYDLSAMDQGSDYKDCSLDPGYSPSGCRVPSYWTFDLNFQAKVADNFTFYLTMNNVFDKMPPVDVVTYGAQFYNPVQGGNGILGRYLKAGVKADF